MASVSADEHELNRPQQVVRTTVVVTQPPAPKPLIFPALLVGLQTLFIVLLAIHGDYGHEPVAIDHSAPLTSTIRSTTIFPNGTRVYLEHTEPAPHRGIADFYAMFQDIHVMIFIGFGFLMTFLKRYGFSAVGYNFVVAAFVVEWALIVRGYMFDFDTDTGKFPIDVERIVVADFVAAAVLISFGAVLGKTSPTQLIIMAFIEVLLQSVNEWIGIKRFCAYDIGESMFVHVFGAYFGIAVSMMLYDQALSDNTRVTEKEKSVYHSDLFSMVGTLFLFCFWPSFNAGVAASGDPRLRAIVNTYISIAASVIFTYACSVVFGKGKLDMVHVQNATLAGGVAVGTVADKLIRPAGAMLIGSVAGALSVVGFHFIKPALQKLRAHDTCGVNNLHGMPGLLAGIGGIILAFFPLNSLYKDNLSASCLDGDGRSSLGQVAYQVFALLVTLGIAIVGGIATGFILRLKFFNDKHPSAYYDDHQYWETPIDFHQEETGRLTPIPLDRVNA